MIGRAERVCAPPWLPPYRFASTIHSNNQREGLVELHHDLVVRAEAANALDQHLVHRAHFSKSPSSREVSGAGSGEGGWLQEQGGVLTEVRN